MELGVIATALQRKFVVQVQPGYTEPLNLWPTPALPSGNRKTQVLNTITKPLRQWESEQAAELTPRVAEAESKRETALAKIAVLRKKSRAGGRQFCGLCGYTTKDRGAGIETPRNPPSPEALGAGCNPREAGRAHG
jgi:Protein of unknown function (DUF3987)